MKKFRLSFLLLSLLLVAVGARADEVTVNEGPATNNYIPIFGYYADAYTRSQFIIPAGNLSAMANKYVTKMTFYANGDVNWGAATFKVSLSEVKEEAFDAEAIAAFDSGTQIYEGSLSVVDGVMVVELDEPFQYKGGNLLVDFSETAVGGYKSVTWLGVEATAAAINGYSYSGVGAISTYNLRNFLPKTTFEYTATVNSCKKPTDVTVSDITTTTATVTWTSDGDAWEVCLNGDENDLIEVNDNPTISLEKLETGSLNTVKVRTVCDKDNKSDWTKEVSFGTEACEDEDKCFLTYELRDAYGYGWFGCTLQVVDHKTGNVIATLGNTTGDPTITGTIPVCPGRQLDFVWNSASTNDVYVASYTIYDVSGEIVAEHVYGESFSSGVQNSYLVDCTVETDCLTPVDLAASDITAHTATLSWTERGTSTSWKVMYMAETDTEVSVADADENPFTLTGLEPETTYYARVYPTCDENKTSKLIAFTTPPACVMPEDVTVEALSTTATISWTGYSDSYNVKYREVIGFKEGFEDGLGEWTTIRNGQGNSNTDWQIVKASNYVMNQVPLQAHTGDYVMMTRSYYYPSSYNVDNWLISPQVTLDGTLSFWVMDDGSYHESYEVCVSTTDKEITSFTKIAEPGNASAEWTEVTVDLSSFKGQKGYIALHHQDYDKDFLFVDDIKISLPGVPEPEWITVTTDEESVELSGLTPETQYEYQIEGVCEEANSKIVNGTFTTVKSCPVPFDIAVKPDLNSVTVTWKGESESYNVRYRKPASQEIFFFEDFENGIPSTWSNIDNDGDGYTWEKTGVDDVDANGNARGFGSYMASSASYINSVGALTPDNWLVTPELDLQGTLSVWLRGQDPSWAAEHFAIYLSTEGNKVENFLDPKAGVELVGETIATGVLTEYTADLSRYAGQKGYIAIRHFNVTDQFRLNVDNFALLGAEIPGTDWITVTADETTAELTGLEQGTDYELEIQGVCDNQPTEWSNTVAFTTVIPLELLDDDLAQPEGAKNTDLLAANFGKVANVTLKDRVFYKDGNWNTLCLPFELSEEQIAESPLAGATIKKIYSADVTGTHVDMVFTEATEITPDMVYIFKWDEPGENIVNPEFKAVTIDYPDVEGPMLYTDNYHFFVLGNYSTVVADPSVDNIYAYYLGADNKLRYSTNPVNLHTFRIYFNFRADDPSAVEFNLNFDGENATGIVEMDGARKADAHEGTFNLQGMKVNEPKQKGIYIQSGRKIVIK